MVAATFCPCRIWHSRSFQKWGQVCFRCVPQLGTAVLLLWTMWTMLQLTEVRHLQVSAQGAEENRVQLQPLQPSTAPAAAAEAAAEDDETAQLPTVFCNPLFGAVTPGPSDSRANKI